MKLAMFVATLTMGASAFASPTVLKCSKGKLGEDTYIQVKISKSKIEFGLHETSFEVPMSKVVKKGYSQAILNQPVTVYSEGTVSKSKIDSLIVYQPGSKTLELTLLMDGYNSNSPSQLNCKL